MLNWYAAAAVALAAALVVEPAALQSRRAVTIDDLMGLRTIVDVRISPDGRRVAYVVSTPSIASNEHECALFVVPSEGGSPRRLAQSVHIFNIPSPAPRLRWTPDGSAVSLLALVEHAPQVVAVPIDSGSPRTVTAAPGGAFAYEWSRDGKRLAYLTVEDPDDTRQSVPRSVVRPADAPAPARRLVVQQPDAPSKPITPASQYVDAFSWAPDGATLAYSASTLSGFTAPYFTRIMQIGADGAGLRTLVDRPGMNDGPRFSPDGRSIAFITTSGRVAITAPRSLAVVPLREGAVPRVFALDDAWVNEYEWTPDSTAIYLEANDGTFGRGVHMFEQPLVRLSIGSGRAERVDPDARVDLFPSVSGDGRRVAYRSVDARTMGDVVVLDTATGRAATLTTVNPQLDSLALGTMKAISWRSFDGMEIWGLLLTPAGARAGQRLPLLVYLHGGPNGGVTWGLFPQFMAGVPQVDPYPVEALTSAGFAVLFPMPRGGAGYGEAGQRMIVNGWGDGDYKDIMAGVDALVADGIVDATRMGVMGASYGGYLTNWIVTQTNRFKAASAGASISDLADLYLLSEGGGFVTEYFGRPWENRAGFAAHSPITFADRVTTPLLIQHGELDARVPIAGALKFYRTLKELGKTVELEIYPRGGHVLREPVQQREQMQRNLAWFTRWIK